MYCIKSSFKLKNAMLAFIGISSLWLFGCISNDNYGNNNVVVEDARLGTHRSTAGNVTRVSSNSSKRQTVVQRNVTAQKRTFQEQPLGSNSAPASGTDYRVVSGDTLFSIAFRYGKSYQALAQENNIDPPYNIKVGDIIHISGSTSEQDVASASTGGAYTVKKGDTLTSVAREHGLPPSAIVRVNNLSYPYKLVPGQRLTLEDPDAKRQVEKSEQKVVPVAGANESALASTKESNSSNDTPTQVVSGRTRTAGGVVWMWPASGKVVKGFSLNENGNKGIDIAGTRGQNVMSAADGQVVYSGSALRGYGKLIIVNHDNEYLSAYAHNDKLLVKEGQKVKRGQVIANMGSTDASRVQLHFEIRYKGKSVNPLGYLPK